MRWSNIIADGGISWRSGCCFDPGTLMVSSLAAGGIGAGASALGQLSGGSAAAAAGQMQAQADDYQAKELEENAGGDIGAAQRQMLDTQQKTRLANSSVQAGAAASGVNAAVGSPVAVMKANAQTGAYHAAMDLWQGQNRAVGDQNQAAALRYSGQAAITGGQMQQSAASLAAAGTVAGGAGGMLRTYGAFTYPNLFGRTGVNYG